MSLDFYLETPYCAACGRDGTELFWANCTHNLGKMARSADIYTELWHPDEGGYEYAGDIVAALEEGLRDMKARPKVYKVDNPPNGWGTYDGFIEFVEGVLAACKRNPDALIRTST